MILLLSKMIKKYKQYMIVDLLVTVWIRSLLSLALRADLSWKREVEGPVTWHRPGAGWLEATTREGHTGTLNSRCYELMCQHLNKIITVSDALGCFLIAEAGTLCWAITAWDGEKGNDSTNLIIHLYYVLCSTTSWTLEIYRPEKS